MIPQLNCAWRSARDRGASRELTIATYVTIGLSYEATVELLDTQLVRYQEDPADLGAGELEITNSLYFNN